MAKYVQEFQGHYHDFVNYIEKEVIARSTTSSLEEKHCTKYGECLCTILVFERYSYLGRNRVSMNVTILGDQSTIQVIAITAGGSQAAFFKMNTIGEESFLETIIEPIRQYILKNGDHAVI